MFPDRRRQQPRHAAVSVLESDAASARHGHRDADADSWRPGQRSSAPALSGRVSRIARLFGGKSGRGDPWRVAAPTVRSIPNAILQSCRRSASRVRLQGRAQSGRAGGVLFSTPVRPCRDSNGREETMVRSVIKSLEKVHKQTQITGVSKPKAPLRGSEACMTRRTAT